MKYLATLGDTANAKETPLLTHTQEKKKLALQGSTGMLTNTGAEREKRTNNQPFFQSRKPINWNTEESFAKIISHNRSLNKAHSSHILPNVSANKASNNNVQMKDSMKLESRSGSSEHARREHNSRLIQAGWIMDSDGKWYKDENVEFDSDEEAPPPPP